MNFDPLMWFALSEMDADDEAQGKELSTNHWQESNEDSDSENKDDEY